MNANPCFETGESLRILKEVIIDHWEHLVRDVIGESKHEPPLILKDYVPELLEQLITILKKGKIDEATEIGQAHGLHRAMMTRYTFEDLLTEFSLLRETIIDYIYPMGSIKCSKLVHKYIDILLKHSSIKYLSEHSMSRQSLALSQGNEIREIKANPVIVAH